MASPVTLYDINKRLRSHPTELHECKARYIAIGGSLETIDVARFAKAISSVEDALEMTGLRSQAHMNARKRLQQTRRWLESLPEYDA